MSIIETFDVDYGDHSFEVEVDIDVSVEPAQRGGMTDPSWDAYAIVEGWKVTSAMIYSEQKNEMVNSHNYLFDWPGKYFEVLDNLIEEYEPEMPDRDDGRDYDDYDNFDADCYYAGRP